MIEEKELLENNSNNIKNAMFTISLMKTLNEIVKMENVDDIYLNQENYDKMEIYVFIKENSLDDEDLISDTLAKWETKMLYFPELFIFSKEDDEKMNILPRSAVRVCC